MKVELAINWINDVLGKKKNREVTLGTFTRRSFDHIGVNRVRGKNRVNRGRDSKDLAAIKVT